MMNDHKLTHLVSIAFLHQMLTDVSDFLGVGQTVVIIAL